jgi:uncharacterized protein (TIGR00725 family)
VSRIVVGVMGPGDTALEEDTRLAHELGGLIAREGWVLLTGGWSGGVMDAASRGAKLAGGLVVGVLPGPDTEGMSDAVDIPIVTGMREARNLVNVLSSRVLFFVGMSAGTASELALALKTGRPAILVRQAPDVVRTFGRMGAGRIEKADTPSAAVAVAKGLIGADAPARAASPPPLK